jgi:hypothetical protein
MNTDRQTNRLTSIHIQPDATQRCITEMNRDTIDIVSDLTVVSPIQARFDRINLCSVHCLHCFSNELLRLKSGAGSSIQPQLPGIRVPLQEKMLLSRIQSRSMNRYFGSRAATGLSSWNAASAFQDSQRVPLRRFVDASGIFSFQDGSPNGWGIE